MDENFTRAAEMVCEHVSKQKKGHYVSTMCEHWIFYTNHILPRELVVMHYIFFVIVYVPNSIFYFTFLVPFYSQYILSYKI